MRLNRLLTEIELGSDFAVGLAVDDQSRDLELALGERFDPGPVRLSRSRAPVDVVSEVSEFLLGSIAIAHRAAALQFGCGGLELRYGPLAFAQLRQRAPGESPGDGRPDGSADLVGQGRGRERAVRC